MKDLDPFENSDLRKLQMFVYLTPIVGVVPAMWTLYRRQASPAQLAVSRLSVTLAFGWLLGYILLGTGANVSESIQLPLLVMNSLLTSGYFAISVWLMIRLSKRQPLRLPGISRIAEGVVRKHL